MIKKFFKTAKKDKVPNKKEYRIIINKKSRDVTVGNGQITFPLIPHEDRTIFVDILKRQQENGTGITFNVTETAVKVCLPANRVQDMKKLEDVRGYLTEISIPVKGFVRHEMY